MLCQCHEANTSGMDNNISIHGKSLTHLSTTTSSPITIIIIEVFPRWTRIKRVFWTLFSQCRPPQLPPFHNPRRPDEHLRGGLPRSAYGRHARVRRPGKILQKQASFEPNKKVCSSRIRWLICNVSLFCSSPMLPGPWGKASDRWSTGGTWPVKDCCEEKRQKNYPKTSGRPVHEKNFWLSILFRPLERCCFLPLLSQFGGEGGAGNPVLRRDALLLLPGDEWPGGLSTKALYHKKY